MVQRRRRVNHRGPKPSHSRHSRSYKILCSGCGKEVVTQVPSPNDKKLLCMECFSSGISSRVSPTLP